MKRLLALVLVLLMVAGSLPAFAAGDQVVLRWMTKVENEEEAKQWRELADDVTKAYSNIVVEMETTDWSGYWTKLPIQLASGDAPDLLYMHALRAQDYCKDSFLNLDSYIANDPTINIKDFYSGVLGSFTIDNSIYGLPYDFGPYILYYNKTLFDKYGVEYPDADTNYEEFLNSCKALTKDGNYGFVFCSSMDYYVPQLLSDGAEIINSAGEFNVMSDEAVNALQRMADLINVYGYAPKIADVSNTVWNWEMFEGGNIGMLIDGPWSVTNVLNYCDFEVGYTTVPSSVKHVTTINGSGFGIFAGTKHPDESYKALSVITSPESQKKLAQWGRALPSRDSVRDYYYESLASQKGLEQAIKDSIAIGIPYYSTKKFQEVYNIFNDEMEAVFAGESTAADAAAMIQSQVNALLG